jgi:poly(A) polymerase
MDKLARAGFVAYLVGGSVRDILLGRRPKDFDISTSARPEEIKKLFRNCLLIGKRFRLAHIRFGKKILEVSTFRAGDPKNEELILRDNRWGSPQEDALRRDFTINGLFYDPSTQMIIDYVGGYEDLKKQLIRSIGQPYIRFKQDPVRMLRLLKFQARFGFEADPNAKMALLECREDITKSAPARVLEETFRMLESGSAKNFIKLITEHGLMHHLLPEIAHFIEKEKEGQGIYAYLEEIDTIFQDNARKNLERGVVLAALAFPLLEKRIQLHYLQRDHTPHLIQIQVIIRNLLTEVFDTFFPIPRRIKISLFNILLGQYRLTPFHKKRSKVKRIPKSSDFSLALAFLKLRTTIEPGLQKVYETWQTLYIQSGLSEEPARKKQRRRPKRKKKSETSS